MISSRFLLISLLLMGALNTLLSQNIKNLEVEWGLDFGDYGTELSVDMTEDPSLNLLITGNFATTVDFNPHGPEEIFQSLGGHDIFLQKRDKNGLHLWTKTFGGAQGDAAKAVACDKYGNVFLMGTFRDTLHFMIDNEAHFIKSEGWDDVFIIKYDSQGNFKWLYHFGGQGSDSGESLCTDAEGNIYVSGFFCLTVDFDPSANDALKTSFSGWNGDTFILKIDKNGNFKWVKSLDGSAFDYGKSIHLDADENIILGGVFRSEVDLDPGPNTIPMMGADNLEEMYIIKLDQEGKYLWGHVFPGLGKDECISISIDKFNNIYAGGYFSTQFVINTIQGNKTIVSKGGSDLFICKIDPSGDILWANSFGGSKDDKLCFLSVNEDNILTISGSFKSTDINEGNISLVSEGNYDALVLFMDLSGQIIDAFSYGNYSVDACHHVILKENKTCLIYGIYSGSLAFNPPVDNLDFHSNGSTDIFIAKLQFDNILSVPEIEAKSFFDIYPNPATDRINIAAPSEMEYYDIVIRNSELQDIFRKDRIHSSNSSISLNLEPGTYLVEIRSGTHIECKKVIVQ